KSAIVVSLALFAWSVVCLAGDSPAGKRKGKNWQPLFNGKDLSGWQNREGNKPGDGWVVEDGAIVRKERAGDIWTKQRFGDFILRMEFKTAGNSGIFIRTDDPKDNVQTGIEVAVNRPSQKPGKHSTGAIYDCLAPSQCADKAEKWNRIVITARDNKISIVLNGKPIIDMDLNKWTEANKNPDGTKNKFRTALKDFKREGHIGLQDHGAVVAYRNIRIRPLKKK
ncbi:MAG: 3-keto-disaccharide hydrolase, partial [Planctomycetota bacterium]